MPLAATKSVYQGVAMFDFAPQPGTSGPNLYDDLVEAASALVAGESDGVANMANVAALIWQFVPELNWAGFYRMVDGELVLGPFIGKPACLRIALGSGVCGTAALSGEPQCVADVHAFPGHIACDAASRSRTGRAGQAARRGDRGDRSRQSTARPVRPGRCGRNGGFGPRHCSLDLAHLAIASNWDICTAALGIVAPRLRCSSE